MSVHPATSDSGYSPPLQIELELHGERLAVAELSSTFVRLRGAVALPPGPGVVRVDLDGRPIVFRADFFDGIDPQRKRQPFRDRTTEGLPAGRTVAAAERAM